MHEFVATLILAVLGFLIGGVIGAMFFNGFFPAAWIGAAWLILLSPYFD